MDEYTTIFLSGKYGQGKTTLVNKSSLEIINLHFNSLSLNTNGYVIGYSRVKSKILRLHRVLMGLPKNLVVDHVNGNLLDNTLDNLRVCTQQENTLNRSADKGSKSEYKGVYPEGLGFKSIIHAKGKRYYLGLFQNEIEAAKAYNEAAKKLHGDFALLNDLPQ